MTDTDSIQTHSAPTHYRLSNEIPNQVNLDDSDNDQDSSFDSSSEKEDGKATVRRRGPNKEYRCIHTTNDWNEAKEVMKEQYAQYHKRYNKQSNEGIWFACDTK